MTNPPNSCLTPTYDDRWLNLLRVWCEINSGSDNVTGLKRMAQTLADYFAKLGASVNLKPLSQGRLSVSISQRPLAKYQILLSGHYDTVFAADHSFQCCRPLPDGRLNAPGAADMKGGIVTMAAALEAFERLPEAANLGWEILLTPDEETGSALSRDLLEETAKHFQLGLVFEPARANGDTVRSRKGTGVFEIVCHGRAAHAGQNPADGRNAIVALAGLLLQIDQLPARIPGGMLNIGHIEGGGAVNIVPDLASTRINIRCTDTATATQCQTEIGKLVSAISAKDGFHCELRGGFDRPPFTPTALTISLHDHWLRCAAEIGIAPPGWQDVGGGSDANILQAAGLPCLDGLGPVGGNLHTDMEYIEPHSIAPRAAVTARFLQQIANDQISIPHRA